MPSPGKTQIFTLAPQYKQKPISLLIAADWLPGRPFDRLTTPLDILPDTMHGVTRHHRNGKNENQYGERYFFHAKSPPNSTYRSSGRTDSTADTTKKPGNYLMEQSTCQPIARKTVVCRAPCQGAVFQRVQIPSGNFRSSRKQSEQS
jgi:hypothetical protein